MDLFGSIVWIDNFEEKFKKRSKKCKLFWQLHPASTIHNDSKSTLSLLRTPTILRKSPRKQKIRVDELVLFQAADKIASIDSISEQNSPENFTLQRFDNSVQLFNLKYNEETGIPSVHKCISIYRNLHVCLSYYGLVIPLSEWFRYGLNCTLTKFSMLENFVSYLRNKGKYYNKTLKKMEEIQHYKPQGHPKYPSMMIRFSFLLQYSSCQTYKLLLEQLLLPSLCLFKKNFFWNC